MSEPRRNARAKCSEFIKQQAGAFVLKEKQRQGIKSSILAERVGRGCHGSFYNDMNQLQSNDFSRIGLDYVFRLVEALGYDVEVSFVPKGNPVASRKVEAA